VETVSSISARFWLIILPSHKIAKVQFIVTYEFLTLLFTAVSLELSFPTQKETFPSRSLLMVMAGGIYFFSAVCTRRREVQRTFMSNFPLASLIMVNTKNAIINKKGLFLYKFCYSAFFITLQL
jgi:hypothetical protein